MEDLIPIGDNKARAESWTWDTTKNGDPMLVVVFALIEHDKRLSYWMAFTANTKMENRVKELRAMGFAGDDLGTIGEGTGGLDANEVSLKIEHEEYPQGSGTMRERIAFVNAPFAARAKNPPSTAMLSALSAQAKGAFRSFDAEKGIRPATEGARPQQTGQTQRGPQQPAQRQQANAAPRTSAQGQQSAQTNGRAAAEPWAAGPPPDFGGDDIPF